MSIVPLNASSSVAASGSHQMNPIGQLALEYNQTSAFKIDNNPLFSNIQTQRSVAEDLLQPSLLSSTIVLENQKVFVSKIPKGLSDEFMERLLKACGNLVSWKRSSDAAGEPKAFGFAEYDSIEALLACVKVINNLPIQTSKLLVNVDTKTKTFLNDWKELKKIDWLSKQEKLGITVDLEDLEQKEQLGEILPYEMELIPNYNEIIQKITETIDNRDIIESVAQSQRPEGGQKMFNPHDLDPFLKYKEHDREQRRERRIKNLERERDEKFKKKQEEWYQRETRQDREKEKDLEREKERLRDRQKLIDLDLAYDSGEEKKKRKKNPKEYLRHIEERKRIRDKEAEDDLQDRKREEEEKVESDKRRAEEQKRVDEQKKREDEIRERLKLKRFMEMQDQLEKQQQQTSAEENQNHRNKRQKVDDEQPSYHQKIMDQISQGRQQQQMSKVQMDLNEEAMQNDLELQKQMKNKLSLPRLSDSIVQNIKNIENEVKNRQHRSDRDKVIDIKAYTQDEEKKKELELVKVIHAKLPRTREDIFKTPLNWNTLFKFDLVEKKGRPWIAKKTRDYLGGVEELSIINLIVKVLNQKPNPQQLITKVKTILDDVTEEFVEKLWQMLVFENMKADEGLYK